MSVRNIILPFLTSVLTLSLLVFVSCAHQNTSEGGAVDSLESGPQEISDAAAEGAPSEEAAESTPQSSGESETAAVESEEQILVEDSATPPEDMVAMTAETPKTETPPATVENGTQEALTATGEELLSEIENQAPSESVQAEVAKTEPPAQPLTSESLDAVSSASPSISSRLPSVPKLAFQKGGTLLNRFYFDRASDTPEKIAALLLGNASKVAALKQWNSGVWKPGRILYYASTTDPSDNRMQSFYQERNVPAQNYTIGRGDWLSKIAAKNFDSPMSWKEIAVLNGIKNPDSVEKGQQIVLMPRDLSGYSGASQFTQKTELPEEEPRAQVATSQPPPQAVAPPTEPPPPEPAPDNVPPPSDAEDKKEHSFDLAGLLEQNLIFIATGAAIILLLVALLAIKKKKGRAAAEEFGDDPLAPPKARRK